MGRRLTYSERAARRSQEDRERRRRAREAEERREERAKKRERERQRALNAAQEEFNEWQETEDALATLAAPKRSVRGTEARLRTGLSRHSFEPGQFVPEVFDARRFVPETFSPAPACNFDEPVGPLAAVVEPIRAAAIAKCAEKVKAEPGPGPALEKVASGGGACCVALIALRTRAGGALFTDVGGWLTVGVVAAASLVIAILAASMKSSRKARVWERTGPLMGHDSDSRGRPGRARARICKESPARRFRRGSTGTCAARAGNSTARSSGRARRRSTPREVRSS